MNGRRPPAVWFFQTGDLDERFISKSILDELLGVLARKFSRNADELARVAVCPSSHGEITCTRRSSIARGTMVS